MNNLLRYNKNQKYLVFDFETCDLNLVLPHNVPWQLGMMVCEGELIKDKRLHWVDWPDLKISAGAIAVTRINWSIYRENCKPALPILEEFESYLYNPEYLIMGHNILGFDIFIHNIFRKRMNKSHNYSYLPRIIDTNACAKAIKNQIKLRAEDNRLAFQYRAMSIRNKSVKTSLGVLGKENKIQFDENSLHDGLNDCILNFEVWNKYIKWNLEL